MGETHSVSISSDGPSGPEAPNAPATEATSNSEGFVNLPTDPQPTEEQVAPERPEWLDDKFESPEELARAYAELQSRMGQQEAEAPEVEDSAPEVGVGTQALEPFAEEYYSTGALSEESFTQLEGMGLSRDLVQAFMEGQQAVQSAEVNQIFAQVGGEEAYGEALAWAAQNMSPEEIVAYNEQVESGDLTTATVAVRGLMAQYRQGSPAGTRSNLLPSEPVGPGGLAPYESVAQLMTDMRSKEYKTDPAFRARVQDRLSRSNVM